MKPDPLPISERELRAMTSDLDELHHVTFPALLDRRRFLLGTGVAFGAAALAACGKSTKKSSRGAKSDDRAKLTGDLAVAALAASLENLAVQTYQAGIDAATTGKLGTVPPAVVTFATTAQAQHRDHANAWNAILTQAGKTAVTGVDATVRDAVAPKLAAVKTVPDLARLALDLENVAAATYLNGIPLVKDEFALKTAVTIQPVEMQHAAILNFVLGRYPVPDAFARVDGARAPGDAIA
jgi:hypothetical protein